MSFCFSPQTKYVRSFPFNHPPLPTTTKNRCLCLKASRPPLRELSAGACCFSRFCTSERRCASRASRASQPSAFAAAGEGVRFSRAASALPKLLRPWRFNQGGPECQCFSQDIVGHQENPSCTTWQETLVTYCSGNRKHWAWLEGE